jgi:nicotinamidase-related amidase
VINFDSSAFSHTDLDGILRAKGVEQLFLAGIATNWVVESTTRYGAELGLPYHATIATSADFVAMLERAYA